jgi:hypothetical protein
VVSVPAVAAAVELVVLVVRGAADSTPAAVVALRAAMGGGVAEAIAIATATAAAAAATTTAAAASAGAT